MLSNNFNGLVSQKFWGSFFDAPPTNVAIRLYCNKIIFLQVTTSKPFLELKLSTTSASEESSTETILETTTVSEASPTDNSLINTKFQEDIVEVVIT